MFFFYANSDEIIACVRTKITNGVTLQSRGASEATGVMAVLLAVAASVIGALVNPGSGDGATNSAHLGRRLDPLILLFHCQFISSSGLLRLKYSPSYLAFTANFAWANFILPTASFQNTAKRMRKCDIDVPFSSSLSFEIPQVHAAADFIPGIAAYAARVGISHQDMFAVAYLAFLCVFAVLVAFMLLVGLSLQIGVWRAQRFLRKDVWYLRRVRWQQMSCNNVLRLVSHLANRL
jgi:hypothetical protein